MASVYFNQNGMWQYVGSIRKQYVIGDVIKLKRVFYPLKIIKIDNNSVYCELTVKESI